jgi:hypothetical protein
MTAAGHPKIFHAAHLRPALPGYDMKEGTENRQKRGTIFLPRTFIEFESYSDGWVVTR